MPFWPRGLHIQTGTQPRRGAVQHPIRRTPLYAYGQRITGVPLSDGQGQAVVSAAGTATVSLGPQGVGTVWYPASVTVATTTGVLDTSSCDVYAGPGSVLIATSLIGTIFPAGRGVLALAVPAMPVGYFITCVLTGGKTGDVFSVNITGAKDAWAVTG